LPTPLCALCPQPSFLFLFFDFSRVFFLCCVIQFTLR
jgi:hypothetical protein